MSQEISTTIEVTRHEDGAALRILLNQPKGNVLTTAMMMDIGNALDAHADDPGLKMVLIRGGGGVFSFGASVEEHRKEQAPAMLAAFHAFCRKLAGYPVPVAALVEKQCLGGAFELVLGCHFVFATPNASFGCPEIKLGVFPPVLAAVGAQRLGGAVAERLLLSGCTLTSAQAVQTGLVAEIFASEDPEAEFWAWYGKHLAPLSAFALRQGVKVSRTCSRFLEAFEAPLKEAEAQYIFEVLESYDGNEGIEAFLARRQPDWKHQ